MTAFTHISKSGGSRLDQVWVRPALGLLFASISSCIIWDWPFQTDHCPVVAKFLSTIPTMEEDVDRPLQPPWRALYSDAADKELNAQIRENVLGKIGPCKELMEAAREKLLKVREAGRNHDNLDPGRARSIIESAYLAIEKNMLDAIPWPEVVPQKTREPCKLNFSIGLLNNIQKRLG